MICEFDKSSDNHLTENFWLHEFHCHCNRPDCTKTILSIDLVEGLEKIRKAVGKPLRVLSGYRCEAHNKSVGGSPGSRHLTGIAADIAANGVTPKELAQAAKRIELFRMGGLGLYDTFIHVDHRGFAVRW